MDPNMTLHEIRELVSEIQLLSSDPDNRPITRLAELGEVLAEKADALDGWMSKGGFLPSPWRETRDHR